MKLTATDRKRIRAILELANSGYSTEPEDVKWLCMAIIRMSVDFDKQENVLMQLIAQDVVGMVM